MRCFTIAAALPTRSHTHRHTCRNTKCSSRYAMHSGCTLMCVCFRAMCYCAASATPAHRRRRYVCKFCSTQKIHNLSGTNIARSRVDCRWWSAIWSHLSMRNCMSMREHECVRVCKWMTARVCAQEIAEPAYDMWIHIKANFRIYLSQPLVP